MIHHFASPFLAALLIVLLWTGEDFKPGLSELVDKMGIVKKKAINM